MSDIMEFEIYSVGVVNASVCSSLSPKETEERLNRESPSGLSNGWTLSDNKTFAGGEPHPCPCNTHPETHKHYLFHC